MRVLPERSRPCLRSRRRGAIGSAVLVAALLAAPDPAGAATGQTAGKAGTRATAKAGTTAKAKGKASTKATGKASTKATGKAGKGRSGPVGPTLLLPRVVTHPEDPREQRITRLRERLVELLRQPPLSRTRNGVVVMKVSDGDVLFSYNAGVSFNPASNTKMLTTAAALSYLGGEYRYHTSVHGPAPDADGVVHGDVWLRGTGDPSLMPSDLAQLARRLASRGLLRIEGDLRVDGASIVINRNTYRVRVSPGAVGHAPSVAIEPRAEFFVVENRAKTVKGRRSRIVVDAYRRGAQLVVTVRGRIGEARGAVVVSRRIGEAGLLAAHVLGAALGDFGIELKGVVAPAAPPPQLPEGSELVMLAEHRSAPLAEVCSISNKPSNNFVAEAIFKTLGGARYGGAGTLEKGARAVAQFLGSLGIKSGYRIVNGSGLTHENRITATDLASMLRKVYLDLGVAPDFLTSLAVAGIDGTIRNRFQGTDAVGLVRAKTGTLTGVSALSGYVGEKDDVLVFAIFVEGFRNRATTRIRQAQVRLVQTMLRYLKADADPAAVEPLLGGDADAEEEAEDPGKTDYEGDGDAPL